MRNVIFSFIFIAAQLSASSYAKSQPVEVRTLHDEISADLKDNILSFRTKYSVDPGGGFYGSLERDGTPRYDEPKASMWNCPYHNSRMGFEIDMRLK